MANLKKQIQDEIKAFWATVPNMPRAKAIRVIKKALDIIQANQTLDEQRDETTKYHNKRGWCPCDAKWAAELIYEIEKNNFLISAQIQQAAEMFSHYSRQLAEYRLEQESKKQLELV